MNDPVAKAQALQAKALKRSEEAREEAKKQRAMLWHRVKTEALEIAEFLILLNEKMGKPAKVEFKFYSDQ